MVTNKMKLEQKYQALLGEATKQNIANIECIQLCFQTLSLASLIDHDCAIQLAPHGLTEGRFIVLFLLEAAPQGLAPKDIADKAGITRATVTGLLDGLERDGLIARIADHEDRRALQIHLTDKGKHTAKTVFEQHSRWIAQFFSNLSLQERIQLTALLEKVSQNLIHKKET
ncbi:MAG: Transcriptional repressor MprA [Acinetobacter bereziniae]|uniref:Transcriptional repressor MprA n=1 Tax=Acinetobacter bereziniae TaxID=106648 RepID=A0A833PAI7_ACIBZ|nr:MAG: Transcriptional repressor MprA [Acinetobacter bereziniae]